MFSKALRALLIKLILLIYFLFKSTNNKNWQKQKALKNFLLLTKISDRIY
jgi:hypothetical protein